MDLLEKDVSEEIFRAIIPVRNRIHHDSRQTKIQTPLGTMLVRPDVSKGVCRHCGREYTGIGSGKLSDPGITIQKTPSSWESFLKYFGKTIEGEGKTYHFSERCIIEYEKDIKRAKRNQKRT